MNAVAIIPTEAAVEAAWQRYNALAREVVDNPRLLLDRQHCEAFTIARAEWERAFLAWGTR